MKYSGWFLLWIILGIGICLYSALYFLWHFKSYNNGHCITLSEWWEGRVEIITHGDYE
jgi:hypothetical protein